MQVNLRTREECWNADAIIDYAAAVDAKETRLRSNPDIAVISGQIACTGCVENQWGNGTFCSVQLTETQFVVVGERPPSPEDAYVKLSSVMPNFKMVKPGSGKMSEGYIAPAKNEIEPSPIATPKRGLRRLLSR